MEAKYELTPPLKYNGPLPMRFFRDYQSISDLIKESKEPFEPAVDKSLLTDGAKFDFDLDEQEDCSESCEPFN